MSAPDCPVCDGFGVPLGALGSLWWFRCRSCGMDFNIPKDNSEGDDDGE